MSLETIRFEHLDLKEGMTLLDLGCGEGRHTLSAALTAPIHAVGLDMSRRDLTTARNRCGDFESLTKTENAPSLIQGDGARLPFADATFDRIICSEVLEHIHDYETFLREIRRVIKPGGLFAASVPSFFPEWVCWKLSDAYHEVEGGHVRIFNARALERSISDFGFKRFESHRAHALHSPYWWLRCLFWRGEQAQHPIVNLYHRLLVWDLMKKPWLTRWLDRLLNPILGKSVVFYFSTDP